MPHSDHAVLNDTTDERTQEGRRELLIIDERVPDRDALIASVAPSNTDALEVVTIGSEQSGISEIADVLALRSDLSALHLVPRDGVQLGTDWLTRDILIASVAEMSAWGSALSPGAEVIVYGADLESSIEGRGLRKGLAALTGANVYGKVNPVAVGDTAVDTAVDTDVDTDALADTDTDTDADALADTDTDADTDALADTDAVSDADADTDALADTDADADALADTDTDTDADAVAEALADIAALADAVSDSDPDADAIADMNALADAVTDISDVVESVPDLDAHEDAGAGELAETGTDSSASTAEGSLDCAGPPASEAEPSAVTDEAGTVLVSGSFAHAPSAALRLEFVADPVADAAASDEEEGDDDGTERSLGFAFATTDETGVATFSVRLGADVEDGTPIGIRATDSRGDTSLLDLEFVATRGTIPELVDDFEEDDTYPDVADAAESGVEDDGGEVVPAATIDDDESWSDDDCSQPESLAMNAGAESTADESAEGAEASDAMAFGAVPEPVGSVAETVEAAVESEERDAEEVVDAEDTKVEDVAEPEEIAENMSMETVAEPEEMNVEAVMDHENAEVETTTIEEAGSEGTDGMTEEPGASDVEHCAASVEAGEPAGPFALANVTYNESTSTLCVEVEPPSGATPSRLPGKLNVDLVNEAYGTATMSLRAAHADGRSVIGAFTVLARPVPDGPALPDRASVGDGPVFTVAAIPPHARLVLNGTTLTVGATFTPAETGGGRLVYLHDGTSSRTESFRFMASDANGDTLRIIVAAVVHTTRELNATDPAAADGCEDGLLFATPPESEVAEGTRETLAAELEAGPRRAEISFATPDDVAGAVAAGRSLWQARGASLMASTLALLPGRIQLDRSAEIRQAG